MIYIILILSNFVVGGLVGICGIAGFLLPMVYSGVLGYSVQQTLTLSFFAFLISGGIGSYNFYKNGNLDVRISLILSLGSFFGGMLGVQLNTFIPAIQVKLLLYLVVLLSGISIYIRTMKEGKANNKPRKLMLKSKFSLILLGFITGAICSLSGAGGPVLVMPLLVVLGVHIHIAIGVALFNSIFIAAPAFLGYLMQMEQIPYLLFVLVAFSHGIGAILGSRIAHKINHRPLKLSVAVFSIIIAIYMIYKLV